MYWQRNHWCPVVPFDWRASSLYTITRVGRATDVSSRRPPTPSLWLIALMAESSVQVKTHSSFTGCSNESFYHVKIHSYLIRGIVHIIWSTSSWWDSYRIFTLFQNPLVIYKYMYVCIYIHTYVCWYVFWIFYLKNHKNDSNFLFNFCWLLLVWIS